ncbi:OmpA family protein [Adhaeribacter sp. BT258]|uniref:OmpA family protein n=1 Tax=Adhaeribacter terrigena TaxID=2793070 RepID=A0ABS1C641_9BACT|nr:OmpA family protein [Adhaeribacter terrigena]MBK0404845.1 OmpA family protein [Adhaeribacter terrigena]
MKTLRTYVAILMALVFIITSGYAQTTQKKKLTKTTKGGLIGAVAGGVVGGVVGKKTGNTAAGVIVGAAVGGAAGAIIGRRMDKQAEELKREMEGAKVERVGEGIKITFDSGILFAHNSSQLSATAQSNIAELAQTLKKYGDTNVLIQGHTDATGTAGYNQSLSVRRASSVRAYTTQQGISASRITTEGYGESMPVASNNTEAGKQANRRVEIAIYANEKLKKAAEKGQI